MSEKVKEFYTRFKKDAGKMQQALPGPIVRKFLRLLQSSRVPMKSHHFFIRPEGPKERITPRA